MKEMIQMDQKLNFLNQKEFVELEIHKKENKKEKEQEFKDLNKHYKCLKNISSYH